MQYCTQTEKLKLSVKTIAPKLVTKIGTTNVSVVPNRNKDGKAHDKMMT